MRQGGVPLGVLVPRLERRGTHRDDEAPNQDFGFCDGQLVDKRNGVVESDERKEVKEAASSNLATKKSSRDSGLVAFLKARFGPEMPDGDDDKFSTSLGGKKTCRPQEEPRQAALHVVQPTGQDDVSQDQGLHFAALSAFESVSDLLSDHGAASIQVLHVQQRRLEREDSFNCLFVMGLEASHTAGGRTVPLRSFGSSLVNFALGVAELQLGHLLVCIVHL